MTESHPRAVRFPKDWLLVMDAEAAKAGQTFSEWVVAAAYERLPKATREKLSKPRGRGRPPRDEGAKP